MLMKSSGCSKGIKKSTMMTFLDISKTIEILVFLHGFCMVLMGSGRLWEGLGGSGRVKIR